MNGRIYDPLLGRFLSADLVVQFPVNLQSYNRYSYVENNPLTRLDPTGWYSILGLEFTDGGGVGGFVKDLAGYQIAAASGAASGAGNYTVGLAQGSVAAVEGTAMAIAHPVDAVQGVANGLGNVAGRAVYDNYFVGQLGTLVHNGNAEEELKKLHGNDARSMRPQHRYVIKDDKVKLPGGASDTVKTGVANDDRMNQNGTSGRANEQVNKLNKAEGSERYSATVEEKGVEGRQKILDSEAKAAKELKAEGNSMRLHQRPKC